VDGPRAVDRVASEPAAGGAAVGLAVVRAPVEVRYASAGEVGAARSGVRGAGARVPAVPAVPVDVDVASAAELEALPRVGPALARRIVANRDSLGAFGSVGGLRRVRGIGPAVALGLTPYVTFSGRVRPSDATIGGPDAVRSRGSRGRRVTQ